MVLPELQELLGSAQSEDAPRDRPALCLAGGGGIGLKPELIVRKFEKGLWGGLLACSTQLVGISLQQTIGHRIESEPEVD